MQIDHIVPLSESWASGAHSWDQNTRIAFANDPANLVASDGPANEKKGDKDLGQWIVPANPDLLFPGQELRLPPVGGAAG